MVKFEPLPQKYNPALASSLFYTFQDISNQHTNTNDKQKTNTRGVNEPEDKHDTKGKQIPVTNVDDDEEEDEEDAEALVEEEESEFSHFEDDEEFENYRQVSGIS